jgi:hypothetical protein
VGPVNVLYFVVAGNDGVVGEDTEDDVAIKCHGALVPFAEELMKADVR